MKLARDYLAARRRVADAERTAPTRVIERLLDGWHPSRGPSNVGRWWRGMDVQTRCDVYEPMTDSEAAVLDAAEQRITERRAREAT